MKTFIYSVWEWLHVSVTNDDESTSVVASIHVDEIISVIAVDRVEQYGYAGRPGKMIFRTLIVAKGDTRVYVENSVQDVMDIILNCRRHGDGK